MERTKVFVDSNVFIGVLNKDDALHEKALAVWESLRNSGHQLVVSNFIISEVITVVSQRMDKTTALKFAAGIYFGEQREVEVVRLDKMLELKALEHLKRMPSKNISFVDASNLAILEVYRIKNIASFDKVFQKQKEIEVII